MRVSFGSLGKDREVSFCDGANAAYIVSGVCYRPKQVYNNGDYAAWRQKNVKAQKKIDRTDMILHGSLWRAMLMIAVPVMINSFLQTLYNLTDTYWLGQIGTEPLAAINLVTPLQNMIVTFGSGFTVAGAVLISQFVGAGKPERARKMTNQILTASMLFCMVCVAVLELFTPYLVTWARKARCGKTRLSIRVSQRLICLSCF